MKIKLRTILLGLACVLCAAGLTFAGFLIFKDRPTSNPPSVSQPEPEPTGPPYDFDYDWTKYPSIAHAMGGILGDNYTNSLEAFLFNYQLGHRVFEVDLDITDDGHIVLTHGANGWRERAILQTDSTPDAPATPANPDYTYTNFMSSLWYGKYHPLDLDGLFKILQDYPDIYIMTDTKYTDPERVQLQFSELLAAARTRDEKLLDRLIIQIYTPEMFYSVMDLYPWKSVVYSLYATHAEREDWSPEEILAFSQASGVKFITMWSHWISPEIINLWKPAGLKTGVHTVNTPTRATELQAMGVDVIYTDFLLP